MSVYEVTGRDANQSDAANATDTRDRRKRMFHIDDEATEALARQALIAFAPPSVDGLAANTYRVTEVGYQLWEGEIEYELAEDKNEGSSLEVGGFRIRITAGQATQHITHGELISSSVNQTVVLTDGGRVNYYGAIGVNLEEPDRPTVTGIDVPVGTLSMSVTIAKLGGIVASSRFWKDLQRMNGKVNSSRFLGFDPGEVIFRGATAEVSKSQLGPLTAQDPVDISYEFEMSENLRDIPVGMNPITGSPQCVVPEKLGWDILSVITTPFGDTAKLQIYPLIVQADVIRVAHPSPLDFNNIW